MNNSRTIQISNKFELLRIIQNFRLSFFIILSIFSSFNILYSLDETKLIKSRTSTVLYEINDIIFEGNKALNSEDLIKVLNNKSTDRSLPHRGFLYLYEELKANKYSPKYIIRNFASAVSQFSSEIYYFNKNTVEMDSVRLSNYYFQKGFHQSKISFEFYGDSLTRKNILKFIIEEGPRWTLNSLNYTGIDSLPDNLQSEVNKIREIKTGMPFDEYSIIMEVSKIQNKLIEQGYFYSKYEMSPIIIDTLNFSDSVSITFDIGIRQRVGNIRFIDSTHGEVKVVDNMKKAQQSFNTGDWLNPAKITQTEMNLYSLGTFDLVKIDTAHSISNPDSVIDLLVYTNYKKQQEYGVSLFLNRTASDQLINSGIEFSYTHKNIFGAAQVLVFPFLRFQLNNINNLGRNGQIEYEVYGGTSISQPLLWTIDNARIGGSAQIYYSQRIFNYFLRIQTVGLPIKFPIKLSESNVIQNISVDFDIEHQVPMNFSGALDSLRNLAKNDEDRIRILETTALYKNLDSFVISKHPWITSNTITLNLYGDTRNNPFSPTKGIYRSLSIEGLNILFYPIDKLLNLAGINDKLQGITKYIRLQASFSFFWSHNENLVSAFKARAGHLIWFDKSNSYIPFDRQFFAGGANSNRGWQSRSLRYFDPTLQNNPNIGSNEISNYIGSATLIESSYELRFRFPKPDKMWEALADKISNTGITAFVDIGNAYQWLILNQDSKDYKYKYSLFDYFKGLAVAAGIGIRYETPVGPVRLDIAFPIYDPMRLSDPTIFTRTNALGTRQFHIALGHAF